MKILDLTDIDKSDIKYQIINYPDGQRDIVITSWVITNGNDWGKHINTQSVQIKSRLNNAEDLLMIICATKALRNLKVKEIHLYVPYIMGLRSDRLFQEGGNRYVKDIIAPLLNAQNFESVTCIDPHSDVAENCINKLEKISNLELVEFALSQISSSNGKLFNYTSSDVILVSPDAGASKKIYKLAEQIGYKGDVITCSKDRDENGKLTKIKVPGLGGDQYGKDLIIIDDICDGGATFINIVKALKSQGVLTENTTSKIYLIVTHGIFSKGFGELQQYFDAIYTTNSYKQLNPDTQDFVKQLNVY
jgi:ribose-phosphate pyrophosphokinase